MSTSDTPPTEKQQQQKSLWSILCGIGDTMYHSLIGMLLFFTSVITLIIGLTMFAFSDHCVQRGESSIIVLDRFIIQYNCPTEQQVISSPPSNQGKPMHWEF